MELGNFMDYQFFSENISFSGNNFLQICTIFCVFLWEIRKWNSFIIMNCFWEKDFYPDTLELAGQKAASPLFLHMFGI